jgi:hypothetical protein
MELLLELAGDSESYLSLGRGGDQPEALKQASQRPVGPLPLPRPLRPTAVPTLMLHIITNPP